MQGAVSPTQADKEQTGSPELSVGRLNLTRLRGGGGGAQACWIQLAAKTRYGGFTPKSAAHMEGSMSAASAALAKLPTSVWKQAKAGSPLIP